MTQADAEKAYTEFLERLANEQVYIYDEDPIVVVKENRVTYKIRHPVIYWGA